METIDARGKYIRYIVSLIVLVCSGVFLLPKDVSGVYLANYIVDLVLGIICVGLYGYYALK